MAFKIDSIYYWLNIFISCYPKFQFAFLSCAGRAKRLCETELGAITQCYMPKNVQKGGQQYLQNLALKINVKVR